MKVPQAATAFFFFAALVGATSLQFQGKALDGSGKIRPDGPISLTASLYRDSLGTLASWQERSSVTVKGGLFTIYLGTVTNLPDSLFDGRPLFLGVAFGSEVELSPRLRLGAVPLAALSPFADTARASHRADTVLRANFTDSLRAAIYADTADTALSSPRLDSLITIYRNDRLTLQAVRDSVTSLRARILSVRTALATQAQNLAVVRGQLSAPGYLYDARDGQVYPTVQIGLQRWMAANLNYHGSGTDTVGACPNASGTSTPGPVDTCVKYGRLYTWTEAMKGASSSSATPSGVQGICPTGWHVPSDAEWSKLVRYVDSATSGRKLKSASGWASNGNGTDTFGFRALPAGNRNETFVFGGDGDCNLGSQAGYWSSSENPDNNAPLSCAWDRLFSYDGAAVTRDSEMETYGLSLRCLHD